MYPGKLFMNQIDTCICACRVTTSSYCIIRLFIFFFALKLNNVVDCCFMFFRRYSELVCSILSLLTYSGSSSSSSGGGSGGGGGGGSGSAGIAMDGVGVGGGGESMLTHDLSQLRVEMIGKMHCEI